MRLARSTASSDTDFGINAARGLALPSRRLQEIRMRFHLTIAVALMAGTAFAGPVRHFADAPLRAVTFLTHDEGWAVGDDGVIWQTIDGGATWDWRDSGTRASLRAVQFLTPYTG